MATKKTTERQELVPVNDNFIVTSGGAFVMTDRSFAFTEEATAEFALEVAKRLKRTRNLTWILGDLLIASEGRFSDVYEQLEHETGYDYQTLANAKALCKRFPVSLRLWDLSPSFYEVVAPCDDSTAVKYLDMAVKRGFARDDFRDYVREERREAQIKANKTAGVATGKSAVGPNGIGTGKVPAIKVEPSPKSLATVALEHLTQADRGELASLVLANTTGDTVEVKSYDLTVTNNFPVSMVLFALERRVAPYDEDPTAASLVKAIKAASRLADKFEADTPGANVAPPAANAPKPPSGVNKPPAGKKLDQVTPAPKGGAKGKAGGKKADTDKPGEAGPEDGGDGLPVRDLADGEKPEDEPNGNSEPNDMGAAAIAIEAGLPRDYVYASAAELEEWHKAGDLEALSELDSRKQSDADLEADYQALDAGGTDHGASPAGSHGEPDYRNQFGNPADPELHGGAEVFDDKPLDEGDVPGFPPGVSVEYAGSGEQTEKVER